jgi:hypothetical protein
MNECLLCHDLFIKTGDEDCCHRCIINKCREIISDAQITIIEARND